MHILNYISLVLLIKVYNRRHEDYKAGGKVKGTCSLLELVIISQYCLKVYQLTNLENVLFLCWFSFVPSPFSSLSESLYLTDVLSSFSIILQEIWLFKYFLVHFPRNNET